MNKAVVLLFATVAMTGCVTEKIVYRDVPVSAAPQIMAKAPQATAIGYTQQPIEKAVSLKEGMSGGMVYRDSPVSSAMTMGYTQQPIEKAVSLKEGMSESEVISILGTPITRDLQGKGTVMQWCKTGYLESSLPRDRRDQYAIGFFYGNKLVGVRSYQGILGNIGDCSTLYQQIEWTPSSSRAINYKFKSK